MKKLMVTVGFVIMGLAASNAQSYADKASKKNAKMMERSTRRENAARAGQPDRSARQLNKMQKKEDKLSKKSSEFK